MDNILQVFLDCGSKKQKSQLIEILKLWKLGKTFGWTYPQISNHKLF